MENINSFFDKIYIINLPERTERLAQAKAELEAHGITEYEVFAAIKATNGRMGVYLTFYKLIEQAYFAGHKNIMVFEDDVQYVQPLNGFFHVLAIFTTSIQYDIFYLGCNSHDLHENRTPFKKIGQNNVLRVLDAWACHAMIISRGGMYEILKAMNEGAQYFIGVEHFMKDVPGHDCYKELYYTTPLDVLIQQKIQPLGNCYCIYPMIATQRPGYSDIENKHMEQDYLLTRFNQQTEKLFK